MSLTANTIIAGVDTDTIIVNGNFSVSSGTSSSTLNAFSVDTTSSSIPNVYISGNLEVDNNINLSGSINGSGTQNTIIDLSNGISITSNNLSGKTSTTSNLFLNTIGTSVANPSQFLIQDSKQNIILKNFTQTGLFLNNLATTTEVISNQNLIISTEYSSYYLQIEYPFTSLLYINPISISDPIKINLNLYNLPFTENIFLPNTSPGINGQSITVVLLIPFNGYANSFTLFYKYPDEPGLEAVVKIPINQIYTSDTSGSIPSITSTQKLLQTITIIYNPYQSGTTSSQPLTDPACYTLYVDFSILEQGTQSNLFT